MVTTRPPKTIVKPTALGPVANTDTKLLIYGLFQKGRVLAQDALRDLDCFIDLLGWGGPSARVRTAPGGNQRRHRPLRAIRRNPSRVRRTEWSRVARPKEACRAAAST